jgi:hypothetical protein
MFIPLILFTQPDYKSPEKKSVILQFVDRTGRIVQTQKQQLQTGFNEIKSGNNPESLRTNHLHYNQ